MSRSAPHRLAIALGAYGLVMAATGVALAVSDEPDLIATAASANDVQNLPGAVQDPLPIPAQPSPGPVSTVADAPGQVSLARQAEVAPGQRITFWPNLLIMPSGARAGVDPTGVSPQGSLVIPALPDVGVWNGGAKAGELYGSMVIAGHVDSRTYGLGTFAELKKLRKGDRVQLRNGATHLTYQVDRAVQIRQQSLAEDGEFFRQDVAHRLVLITCGGPFDPVNHGYRDNYIVFATPVA